MGDFLVHACLNDFFIIESHRGKEGDLEGDVAAEAILAQLAADTLNHDGGDVFLLPAPDFAPNLCIPVSLLA